MSHTVGGSNDTGGRYKDTGGEKKDGGCEDSEESKTFMGTTFFTSTSVCINQSSEITLCRRDSYVPVYSPVTRRTTLMTTDPCARAFIFIAVVVLSLLTCKLHIQCPYVEFFSCE